MTSLPNKDKPACLLKETRQQKGITLEMVHEATKIPLDALKAIEQGYSVHKLQTFYYRGFIKIYTKYLELDETQVLQEYGMLESAAPKPRQVIAKETKAADPLSEAKNISKEPLIPSFNHAQLKQIGLVLRVIAVGLVLFFVFKWTGNFFNKSKNNTAKDVQKSSKPVIKQPVRKTIRTANKDSVEGEGKADSTNKASQAKVVDEPVESRKEEGKVVSQSEEKSEKKQKRIELTVRSTKSGWLQVKVDGQVVFQSTLKKGDSETWKADAEIELSGKNINLLEFELNGKMLGALGASDRGAKKVVFTKDGLSVKK